MAICAAIPGAGSGHGSCAGSHGLWDATLSVPSHCSSGLSGEYCFYSHYAKDRYGVLGREDFARQGAQSGHVF